MRKELDTLLCERYPKLFVNRNGDMTETAMCWGFSCGDGWFDLIDTLCRNIQSYIDNNSRSGHEIPQVIATQVKEKFGTLSFYYSGGDELIHGMVWFAGSMSGRLCETCGNPGERQPGGWVRTLCKEHAQ